MTVQTKDQLLASFTAAFADNNTGDISASILLTQLIELLRGNLGQRQEIIEISPYAVNALGDTDAIIGLVGADQITLPPNAPYFERFLYIFNDSGGLITLFPQGGQTVNGGIGFAMKTNTFAILTQNRANPNDWNSIFYSGTLAGNGIGELDDVEIVVAALTSNQYLRWNQSLSRWENSNLNIENLYAFENGNALITNTGPQGEFVPVECDLQQASGPNFSVSGNQITYNGTQFHQVQFNWSFCGQVDQNENEIGFRIYKDFGGGSEQVLFGETCDTWRNNRNRNASLQCRAFMSPGDVFTITCADMESNNREIVIKNQQILLTVME